MGNYFKRLLEKKVEFLMRITPIINIQGPKFSGKTKLAESFCKTVVNLADPKNNYSNKKQAQLDVYSVFEGEKPLLIDE